MNATSQRDPQMTWSDLVTIEPALAELYRELRRVQDDPNKPAFCANWVWYGYGDRAVPSYKDRMMHLVGFTARQPQLQTMQAYDVTYKTLYNQLPDCRNCNCM
jgi:hypothetical protein